MSCTIEDIHKILPTETRSRVNLRGEPIGPVIKLKKPDSADKWRCSNCCEYFTEWADVLNHIGLEGMYAAGN